MSNVIDENLIFLNYEANNYENILEILGKKAIDMGIANSNYVEGLKEREAEFATGVPVEPIGVAIPHTDSSYVNDNKVAIMTLKQPVEFNLMGGSANDRIEVKLVILLLFKDGKNHIGALQNIIEKIQDEIFVSSLVNANTKEEILKIAQSNLNNIL